MSKLTKELTVTNGQTYPNYRKSFAFKNHNRSLAAKKLDHPCLICVEVCFYIHCCRLRSINQ